ncbi:hypothetical protein IFM61606_10450 [Aspergillus udagawae]|nr:hypothetical protein IFM61606_10450 [Aspergillus udagawae]
MWYITANEDYATKATQILDAWGRTLKVVNGTDSQLAAAISGSRLVNAAEISRYTYPSSSYPNGWTSDSISAFSTMVQDILVPPASLTNTTAAVAYPFEANWGTSGEKFMLAAAAFTENTTLYNYAKELILYSSCANLSVRPPRPISELDNRLLSGLEYTAKYLMGGSVPYDESFVRCDADLLGGPWPVISSSGMTPIRPIWEAGYAHYVNLKGLSMPYTKALIQANTPDGQNPSTSIADNAAFETLRFRLENSGL